jgi:hypothetical protein
MQQNHKIPLINKYTVVPFMYFCIVGNQICLIKKIHYETNMLLHKAQENDNNFQQHGSSIPPLKIKLLEYETYSQSNDSNSKTDRRSF